MHVVYNARNAEEALHMLCRCSADQGEYRDSTEVVLSISTSKHSNGAFTCLLNQEISSPLSSYRTPLSSSQNQAKFP